MGSIDTSLHKITLDIRSFYRAVGHTGGLPSDDDPLPPGPWDPVVRLVLRRLVALPQDPVPWRVAGWAAQAVEPMPVPWLSRLADHLAAVALNPQPLPPREVLMGAVAREVVMRAELMAEMARVLPDSAGGRDGAAAGGYVLRFADDWCGTGFRLRLPRPRPKHDPAGRPDWETATLERGDCLAIGAELAEAAEVAVPPALQDAFATGAAQFAKRAVGL
jgi:hypothetical protein